MSHHTPLARLILWRGKVPVLIAALAALILALFAPSGRALLAAPVAGGIVAGWLLLRSKHTSRIESMAAELIRVNHRLNREIEERTRIETELATARDEALELSRLKSQFLATMSHEIRTPMNGIAGMTDLLMLTRLTPEQRDFAEAVRESTDSLMAIIGDILDFAQIEAATVQLQRRCFGPRAIVESTLELLAGRAEAKNLKLTREIDAAIPPLLIGDAARFRQMLLILIGNAIKFTERGEVFVSVTASQPDASSAELRVAVHDTGIGIAPEHQRLLFQSFFQSDGSTTRKHGGAGLGLAICQRLAHLMAGRIEVESQLGKGSTFTLTIRLGLPAAQELHPEPARTKAAPKQ